MKTVHVWSVLRQTVPKLRTKFKNAHLLQFEHPKYFVLNQVRVLWGSIE